MDGTAWLDPTGMDQIIEVHARNKCRLSLEQQKSYNLPNTCQTLFMSTTQRNVHE